MPNLTVTHPDDREHIARGALVAISALPIAASLPLIPLPLERIWLAVVCLALPFIVRFLYTRGSGGYLVSGKPWVVVISIASLLLAALTSNAATMHAYYVEFGGAGSILTPGFLRWFPSTLASPELFFSLIAAGVTGVPALILMLVTAPKPPIRKVSEMAQA